MATFFSNLEDHDQPLVTWEVHHLKPGETLDKVAARYGLSLARLKEVNGLNRGKVVSVRSLLVPARSEAEEPELDTARFVAPEVKVPKIKVVKKSSRSASTAAAATKTAAKGKAAAKPARPVVVASRRSN